MLSRYINQILKQNSEYAGIVPVIEKEILHHDIMHILVEQGALQHLTFIGALLPKSERLTQQSFPNSG